MEMIKIIKNLIKENNKILTKTSSMTWFLIKLMLPISIGIRILENFGLIELIANKLAPIMNLVGLSGEMGIVWITGMLTNIYGGLISLFNLSTTYIFTKAEITILSTMILIAHSMFVETKVLKEAGGKAGNIVFIRIISALLVGAFMNIIFSTFNLYDKNVSLNFVKNNTSESHFIWLIGQFKNYFNIFVIIYALLVSMVFLQKIGFINIINKILKPVLSILGISEKASTINLVSLTLGISYGGALLIEEGRSGRVTEKDLENSTIFMALCHAIIEDTLLMIGIGASIWGVLGIRFIYAFLFVYFFNKLRKSFVTKKREAY